MPRQARERQAAFDGDRLSVDFLPMILRTRFLITALFLCHQLLAHGLVTRQLLFDQEPKTDSSVPDTAKGPSNPAYTTACATQAATQDTNSTTICALQQEKDGDVYKLRGNAEIHYRDYVLRADELTYDSNTGETTAIGHFTIDGGPNDDHIQSSHGTY